MIKPAQNIFEAALSKLVELVPCQHGHALREDPERCYKPGGQLPKLQEQGLVKRQIGFEELFDPTTLEFLENLHF